MRPVFLWALLLCLALAPAVHAGDPFNISAYLYDNEDASSVQASALASPGSASYVLYTIGGIPSVLTADGAPMTEANDIALVLRDHQSRTLMPTSDELASLRAGLLSFNASRNLKSSGGRSYPFGLEETCLTYTNLKYAPCSDSASCAITAAQLCVRYDTGTCLPDQISPYLLSYEQNIKTLDRQMKDALARLDDISIDNGREQLAAIRASISSLQAAAESQSKSKLRATVAKSCPDCLGICPEPNFDTDSLSGASTLLDALSQRISGIQPVSITSVQVAQSTAERIAYAQSAAQLAVWGPQWDAFKAKYGYLRTNATLLLSINKDSNVSASAQAFQQLWAGMDTRMTSRNFVAIESDFTRLTNLVPSMQAALAAGTKPLDEARAAQNRAGDALISARWRVLPSDTASVLAYNRLAALKSGLDANLTPPLTTAQYASLSRAYANLSASAAKIHSTSDPSDPVGRLGRRFSEQSVNGVFSLASAITPLSSTTRSQMAPAIPPIILLVADLAIASILLVVFIGLLLYFRPMFKTRAMLGVWMILLLLMLFGLGLGSVALYLVMNQNAQTGTLDDFMRVVALSNSSYIAIDQSGAPSDSLSAMSNCAANISHQLRLRFNKTTEMFTYSGTACAWPGKSNLSASKCFDLTLDRPVFVLHYNKTSAVPRFSTVYVKQAEAWGDTPYYARCEIGDVLN